MGPQKRVVGHVLGGPEYQGTEVAESSIYENAALSKRKRVSHVVFIGNILSRKIEVSKSSLDKNVA